MQAKALFDFQSGGPGELSFSTDELLTIVRQVISLHYATDLFIAKVSMQMINPVYEN